MSWHLHIELLLRVLLAAERRESILSFLEPEGIPSRSVCNIGKTFDRIMSINGRVSCQ